MKVSEQAAALEVENAHLKRQLKTAEEGLERVEAIYQRDIRNSLRRIDQFSPTMFHKDITLSIAMTSQSLEYGGIGYIEAVIRNAREKLIDACVRFR